MAFKIFGKIVSDETGVGIPHLEVKAVDKDLFFDDFLGTTITDTQGLFEIIYDREDFQEVFFDQKPDLFLEIRDRDGNLLLSTQEKVRYGAGQTEEFLIQLPFKTPNQVEGQHVQTPHFAISHDMELTAFERRCADLDLQDYRLTWINGYFSYLGVPLFAGIWARDGLCRIQELGHYLTTDDFETRRIDLDQRGFQIKCLSGYFTGTETRFSAIWQDGDPTDYQLAYNLNAADFETRFSSLKGEGYALVFINSYFNGHESNYAGIWSKGNDVLPSREGIFGIQIGDYERDFESWADHDYALKLVDAHHATDGVYYAGIWVRETGYEPQRRHNIGSEELFQENIKHLQNDFEPRCLSGYRLGSQNRFDVIWAKKKKERDWYVMGNPHADAPHQALFTDFDDMMYRIMREWERETSGGEVSRINIPNACLAVTYNQKLVLARSYNWITGFMELVPPTTLFRIGSISKAITGTAVMQLIDSRRLDLEDKIVDIIDFPWTIIHSRLNDVKVKHLLRHRGGWEKDAMGSDEAIASEYGVPLPITQRKIMQYMTENRDMTMNYAPGTDSEYIGYDLMLLTLAIERISGQSYEDYVKDHLLAPLGIRQMRLGRDWFQDRATGEAISYAHDPDLYNNIMSPGAPQNVMLPYGTRNYVTDNSIASWLASPIDLVRFASAFDDPSTCPILGAGSIREMFSLDPSESGGSGFACGWTLMGDGKPFHGGKTKGTRAGLIHWHKHKQVNIAVAFNKVFEKYSKKGQNLWAELQNVVNNVPASDWPTDYDLFPSYGFRRFSEL